MELFWHVHGMLGHVLSCSDFGFCDGEAFLMMTKLSEILDLKEEEGIGLVCVLLLHMAWILLEFV